MVKSKVLTFTVENPNGFPFPVDMLRYDQCVPVTPVDSNKIKLSSDPRASREERRVRVDLRSFDSLAPTREMWRSFGWVVV